MMQRVELPWIVYYESLHAAVTRYRGGRLARTTTKHFATKDEAVAFCGDAKRVLYRPGLAWTMREIEESV